MTLKPWDTCFYRNTSSIQTLFDYIEGGVDINEFPGAYPSVSKDAAIQVLEYAKTIIDYRKDSS